MKFFIDFESTQFNGNIISIGCVCENGKQFQTLVRPPEGDKVSGFITKLTGITNEMLVNAPSANEAFTQLFTFVNVQSCDDSLPEYYFYGETDVDFIKHTMKHMTDVVPYTFAQAIAANLIDYSKDVKTFFVSPHRIALRKVYNLIKEEEVEQHHDALEDAIMLAEVVEKMKSKCRPEDNAVLAAMPAQAKPAHKKAPEMFLEWPNNMWDQSDLLDLCLAGFQLSSDELTDIVGHLADDGALLSGQLAHLLQDGSQLALLAQVLDSKAVQLCSVLGLSQGCQSFLFDFFQLFLHLAFSNRKLEIKKAHHPINGTKGIKLPRYHPNFTQRLRALLCPVTVDGPPTHFLAETPGRTKRRHTQDGFQPVTIPL